MNCTCSEFWMISRASEPDDKSTLQLSKSIETGPNISIDIIATFSRGNLFVFLALVIWQMWAFIFKNYEEVVYWTCILTMVHTVLASSWRRCSCCVDCVSLLAHYLSVKLVSSLEQGFVAHARYRQDLLVLQLILPEKKCCLKKETLKTQLCVFNSMKSNSDSSTETSS